MKVGCMKIFIVWVRLLAWALAHDIVCTRRRGWRQAKGAAGGGRGDVGTWVESRVRERKLEPRLL